MIKVEDIHNSIASRHVGETAKITITEKWSLYVTAWEDKSLTISVVKDNDIVNIVSSSTYYN